MIKYNNFKIIKNYNNKKIKLDCDNITNKHNGKIIPNCYLITYSLENEYYHKAPLYELFQDFFDVLNGEKSSSSFGGEYTFLEYNIDNLVICDIYDLNEFEDSTLRESVNFCVIETIEFMKLILIWAEANYYLQKKLNKNWDITMNWIIQQWKLIEEYESNLSK
jgi:hypothetical protein